MKKKAHHLIELNRRREINRRIRLVKARMRDMPIERSYAEGRLEKLPTRITRPPDWALAASRLAAAAVMKPVEHLQPKEGQKYTSEDLWELIGVLETLINFIHFPTAEEQEVTKDIPEIADLKKPIQKQTGKAVLRFFDRLNRLSKSKKSTAPKITWEKYCEYRRRQQKGQSEFITNDGQLVGLQTQTSQLYYIVWMFWPDLQGKFSAPSIHDWFRRQLGESTSDKTVEAVVTKIRKEAKKLPSTLIPLGAQ